MYYVVENEPCDEIDGPLRQLARVLHQAISPHLR